jgi:hypothetical protein
VPFALNECIAEATHVQVGVQVIGQIVVGGGEEEADAGARAEFAEIEGQDFGQHAIEDGGEFVGEEEWRGLGGRSSC